MSQTLSRLRLDLEFMPSPVADRPGLLIRDPFGYSDVTLVIPPGLIPCLSLFDGEQTELDLRAALVQLTGELEVSSLQEQLIDALSGAGFLHDEGFQQRRERCRREFAECPERQSAHAGTAYPEESGALTDLLTEYLGTGTAPRQGRLAGIAAPHVSPFGGWQAYAAAYRTLRDNAGADVRDCTFVVLGTSHYGEPERFGLTRKGFATPFGVTRPSIGLIDEIERRASASVKMEDYCHAIEHSIEFQVIFLQHLFGAHIQVLPILCGSFASSIYEGGLPEDNENVHRFFDVLGDLRAREGKRLLWVLGVDMAHMGQRYNDEKAAHAGEGEMIEVARRDQQRMESINASDARRYWDLVQTGKDDLKWCGSAPFYTFLKTYPGLAGETLRYEQWNIDEESVVSFAGMAFRESY